MSTIRIPAALRDCTSGQSDVAVDAQTVAEALDVLARAHPRLRRHLYSERGGLRNYVNVFVNQDEIRSLDGLETKLGPADTLYIVPSIAGG